MPGDKPGDIDEVFLRVEDDVGALEGRLAEHLDEIERCLAGLERQRAVVQHAIEERDLERVTLRNDEEADDPGLRALRRQEDELREAIGQASARYRQLSSFTRLVRLSRQQMAKRGELPGIEEGQRLAAQEAVIRAREDERRRLAREIHDGPAQVLANAIIGLEFIGRSLQLDQGNRETVWLATEIDQIKGAMREGLSEIRRCIFDLMPSMLKQHGLAATVAHYIQTYQHLFSCTIDLEVGTSLPRLTPEEELTAFRVIQESLQNVLHHAGATQTRVVISTTEEGFVVEVRDNGQGFRPSETRTEPGAGFGLVGMRERAEVLGARLTVTSEPGAGAEVRLVIPVDSRAARTLPAVDIRRHPTV